MKTVRESAARERAEATKKDVVRGVHQHETALHKGQRKTKVKLGKGKSK